MFNVHRSDDVMIYRIITIVLMSLYKIIKNFINNYVYEKSYLCLI